MDDKNIKKQNCILRFICWLCIIFINTAVGFICLSIFIWLLSVISFPLYTSTTKWANQPKLMNIKSCDVKNLNIDAVNMLPDGKNLKKVQITFNLDLKSHIRSSYVIYTTNSFIGKITENDNKKFSQIKSSGYFIKFDEIIHSDILTIFAYYDSNKVNLEDKKYDSVDCPLKFEFFGE